MRVPVELSVSTKVASVNEIGVRGWVCTALGRLSQILWRLLSATEHIGSNMRLTALREKQPKITIKINRN